MLLAITNLIIGLCHLAQSWTFVGMIRRRHDKTVGYVFWLMGTFFLFAGVNRLCYGLYHIFAEESPKSMQAVILGLTALATNMIAALVSLAATVFLIWITPRVMKIPSITDAFRKSEKVQSELYHLRQDLAELARGEGDDQEMSREYALKLRAGLIRIARGVEVK